jgi:hypothetical protein
MPCRSTTLRWQWTESLARLLGKLWSAACSPDSAKFTPIARTFGTISAGDRVFYRLDHSTPDNVEKT